MSAEFWIMLFILLFAALWLLGMLAFEWLRQRQVRTLAAALGLRFRRRDPDLPRRYGLPRLSVARNVLDGRHEGYPIWVFDWYPRHYTCFLVEHQSFFPALHIHPRDEETHIPLAEDGGIAFESVEFTRAFHVQCADRKFAYAVCHPRIMEYLLRYPDSVVDIEAGCIELSITRNRHFLPAKEIPERLHELVEIRNLLPAYLFADYAKERP